jgi:hypothetical protein
MTKRFTAIIIIANIIMGVGLFLSSELVIFTISGYRPPIVVLGVGVFSIQLAYAEGSSPVPLIAWLLPNYPVYILLLFLIVNAFFIIELQRSKESK